MRQSESKDSEQQQQKKKKRMNIFLGSVLPCRRQPNTHTHNAMRRILTLIQINILFFVSFLRRCEWNMYTNKINMNINIFDRDESWIFVYELRTVRVMYYDWVCDMRFACQPHQFRYSITFRFNNGAVQCRAICMTWKCSNSCMHTEPAVYRTYLWVLAE